MTTPIRTAHEMREAAAKVVDRWAEEAHLPQIKKKRKSIAADIRALPIEIAPVAAGEFVLVPCEPTEAMLAAVERVDFGNEDERAMACNVWNAMLSAAPQPPAPESEVERLMREQVARLVDPRGWADRDDYFRRAAEWQAKGLPENHALVNGYRSDADRQVADTLTKADAILRLFALNPGAGK